MTQTGEAMAQSRLMRRNLPLLLGAQGVLGIQMPMLMAAGGLAGGYLASSPSMATLTLTSQMVGVLLAATPLSIFMGKFGRRPGFLVGALGTILGGALATTALFVGSFWLLCFAHLLFGFAQASVSLYRFAAADAATDKWKSSALSFSMSMGLVAALVAPQVVKATQGSFDPIPFAGVYAATMVVGLIGALPLLFVNLPKPRLAKKDVSAPKPSVMATLKRPQVAVSILAGSIAFAAMVLIMVPTPMAMGFCGFDLGQSSDVIGWHVIAMFGPSFFTGFLINRFGGPAIISFGMVLLALSCVTLFSGIELVHFYGGLILLGLGWNFAYIGASTYLNNNLTPEERPTFQGLNDTIVALVSAVASLVSGAALDFLGWEVLVLLSLPAFLVTTLAVISVGMAKRQQVAA
ncbi:MFS transporter [Rhodobacteraceae bacterium RKSG542]|uniref:MFS transporter n=1 Tax=Pseudovibrio flavus TaxID=2529854 RepID=UPI0012BCAA9C|nr:MFS transporter [Pseudovibrio flavus]MTI16361.1 MFS transporter [Pseudovibrio flavus]